MSHATVVDQQGNIFTDLKNEEPVVASAGILWVLAQLGTILVGHKIIGTQQWTSLTNTLAPIIITAVLAAVAWVTRSLVDSPATAAAKTEALNIARSAVANGVLQNADLQKLGAYLAANVEGLSTKAVAAMTPPLVSAPTIPSVPLTSASGGSTTLDPGDGQTTLTSNPSIPPSS